MLKKQVLEDYGIYLHLKERKKRGVEELLIDSKEVGSFYSCTFHERWKGKYPTYYKSKYKFTATYRKHRPFLDFSFPYFQILDTAIVMRGSE